MLQVKMNNRPASDRHYIKLSINGCVYVVNHYERSLKAYSISKADDINAERFIKSTRLVFIGFDY